MSVDIPDNLPELTRAIIDLRQKPSTEERFKAYPQFLQRLRELVAACDDPAPLKQVLAIDTGFFIPPGYRQQIIEKLLEIERTPAMLRTYAMQLELFGDVDDYGNEDLDIDERVEELYAEADALETSAD